MAFAITTLFLILLLMQITTTMLLSFISDCAILHHTACLTLISDFVYREPCLRVIIKKIQNLDQPVNTAWLVTCSLPSGTFYNRETFAFWSHKFHTNNTILSRIWPETLTRPFPGKIATSNMALKWRHETNKMVTNNTRGWNNCNSDEDNLSAKTIINCTMPTGTWLPPQCMKRLVLKIKLGKAYPP